MAGLALAGLALAVALPAAAQDGGYRVVNGDLAAPGAWPDAVGLWFSGQYVGCTGTLIASDVVLTAAHCVQGIDVSHVSIGSVDWWQDEGELIEVSAAVAHPSYDIAVLRLAEESSFEPRAVGMGCALDEYLFDGADVAVVGYGITSATSQFNTQLREGFTVIDDADCSEYPCQRDKELWAGTTGANACSGDSGGPLYLMTEVGDFVIGATSRGPEGCRNGAIWVRPDAFIDWIEDNGGAEIPEPTCSLPPVLTGTDIVVPEGRKEKATLTVTAPDIGEVFTWEIAEYPAHGVVTVDGEGEVVYTADKDYIGPDSFWVSVTDSGYPAHTDYAEVVVTVTERAFLGCNSAAAPMSAAWLLPFGGLLLLGRRRD